MVGSWANAQHLFVDAVAGDQQSMSLVETAVLGALVHNGLVKVRSRAVSVVCSNNLAKTALMVEGFVTTSTLL
jgi:hypothetical protein